MNPYIRYGCGAQAAAVKITNSENMHVIPFMRCGSRRAYGSAAGFFLHHGVMHAAAIGPPQWRIGMVCTPVVVGSVGLVPTTTEVSKSQQPWGRTVMKN